MFAFFKGVSVPLPHFPGLVRPAVAIPQAQRHAARFEVRRVPVRLEAALKAKEAERRAAAARKPPALMVLPRLNLNFDAAVVGKVGGRARHELPIQQRRDA